MDISYFDYDLPANSIAQRPLAERDASRMLFVERSTGLYTDHRFAELAALLRGDELMIFNNSKVIPARLFARRAGVHAQPPGRQAKARQDFLTAPIEVLLVRRIEGDVWEALVRPGRKVGIGERLMFDGADLEAEVIGRGSLGLRRLSFRSRGDVWSEIARIGHVPLPPYIRRADEPSDHERYQTIFARQPGSVAAPTAGLHFSPAIMDQLKARGVEQCEITLEVGLGTFQPIHAEALEDHKMHSESYEISESTAAAIARAKRERRRILAVGTTVVRALEDASLKAQASGHPSGTILPGRALAEIFIRPGHDFAAVDQMLTNFHLPRSTLLVLVAAFAGRDLTLAAYRHAVANGYRFYSHGDCMLIR